eukprot:150081_1
MDFAWHTPDTKENIHFVNMSLIMRSAYQRLHLLKSKSTSIIYTCTRGMQSLEAIRKTRPQKIAKRKRLIRSELQEGEPEILYSTNDTEIQTDTQSNQTIQSSFVTQQLSDEINNTQSIENEFDKLLPEIRKPIKPIGEYLYGPNAIYAALKSNKRPFYHRLYLSPIIENDTKIQHDKISKRKQNYHEIISLCNTIQIPIEHCSKKELNHFVSKNMHQGFVLDCDQITFPTVIDNPLEFNNNSIWIAFDHLFNEENVGAVLRSALFFGVNGIIYSNKHCAPLSPLVATTSSGALDCIDIRLCTQLLGLYLNELKGNGWNIIGLDVNKDKYGDIRTDINKFKCTQEKPMIVVIGNESRGLSDEVVNECDQLVYIGGNKNALKYNVDSLNVASACSVALYQIMHNRFC